jgi:uncharacterized membrane protein (DUF4010 family)
MPWLQSLLEQPEWRLAVAFAVGLLLGAERERRKAARSEADRVGGGAFGLRTFTLTALMGGSASLLGEVWLVALGAVFVGAVAITAIVRSRRPDSGTTTEIALFFAYVLGVVAMHAPGHALAIGVLVALLLALRTRLHAAVRSALSEDVLIDGLTVGVAALVVLPLLPNRTIDPFGVVNPFVVWRLVVVVMAVRGLGRVAERVVGPRYGLLVAGFTSGFASGAATVAAMGAHAKEDQSLLNGAVSGASAGSVATYVQLALLIGAANATLLSRLSWSLGAGALCVLSYALFFTSRAEKVTFTSQGGHGRSAFDLKLGLVFAAMVTGISIASTLLQRTFGDMVLQLAAAIAGFADAHAISASVAAAAAEQAIALEVAAWAVMLALTTNTITKAVLARSGGTGEYARRTGLGLVLMLAASWSAFLLA